jgi:hypothetical protein
MVFNPQIPKPSDLLSNSQGDLLSNNGFLNASFSRNHVPLNIATNNGKHTFIELPVLSAIPNPTPPLSAGQGTLYTKTVTQSQIFFTPGTSGNEYQLTRVITASFGSFSTNPGWSFLPGGLLIQWGTMILLANNSLTTVSFPVPFVNAANVFSIQLTKVTTDNSSTGQEVRVSSGSVTGSQFQISQSSSSSSNQVYWMAIGK